MEGRDQEWSVKSQIDEWRIKKTKKQRDQDGDYWRGDGWEVGRMRKGEKRSGLEGQWKRNELRDGYQEGKKRLKEKRKRRGEGVTYMDM